MSKKIFVTGGAGFIGSNLVKRLVSDGHEVTVMDKLLRGNKLDSDTLSRVKFVNEDVLNYDAIHDLTVGCDVIFHFAAILGVDVVAENPVETMEVEAIGTRNVAKAALRNGVDKILYASTSGIYGHSSMEQAVNEEIIVDPRTSYAMAKRFNEIYFSAYHEEKNMNAICLRFFNVYGNNQDNRMVIPRFFEQALNDEPLTVFGSGKQTRDFTHVDDSIEACIRLMDKVEGFEIFNIANESEKNILELAHTIKKITGSKSEIKFIDAPSKRYDYEVERRVGSSAKLLKHTGFQPSIQLKDGLAEIYKHNYQPAL